MVTLRPLNEHISCFVVLCDLFCFFCVFQDYLLSHMYSNAARDDLWSKLSQVTLTWTASLGMGREEGAGLWCLSPPQLVYAASERPSRFTLLMI